MGRYFGLINSTKKHHVSSEWKYTPPSLEDVKKVAKHLQWNLNEDIIRSASYCKCYVLRNQYWVDEQEESMRMLDERCRMSQEDKPSHRDDWMQYSKEQSNIKYEKFGYNGESIVEFDGTCFCN